MTGLLTVDDVAQMLQVDRQKIYKLKKERKIPYFQIDGTIRFRSEDIEKWLAEHTVKN